MAGRNRLDLIPPLGIEAAKGFPVQTAIRLAHHVERQHRQACGPAGIVDPRTDLAHVAGVGLPVATDQFGSRVVAMDRTLTGMNALPEDLQQVLCINMLLAHDLALRHSK